MFRTRITYFSKVRIIIIQVLHKLKTKQFSLQRSKQSIPFGQSINHYIFLTILVLDHIKKYLNEFQPLAMSHLKLTLRFQKLQTLMAIMNYEFPWPQILLPCLQSPYQSVQLFVICGIIQCCPMKLFTKVCNWFIILHQYDPYSRTRNITFNVKSFIKIRQDMVH